MDPSTFQQLESLVHQNWSELLLAGVITTSIYAMCKAADHDRRALREHRFQKRMLAKHLNLNLKKAKVTELVKAKNEETLLFELPDKRYAVTFSINYPFEGMNGMARGSMLDGAREYKIVGINEYAPPHSF